MPRRRAATTTSSAANAAIAACASPSCSSPGNNVLSTGHLLQGTIAHDPSTLDQQSALGQPGRLRHVMSNQHTGEAAFADNLLRQAFDLRLGVIIERRR